MAGDRNSSTPARFLANFAAPALLLALGAACAGATRKDVATHSALAELPGRWDNGYVEIKSGDEPLKLHYVAAGPRDAPRVILLHGFPDFSYTWREIVPLLVKDYRVLAPDMRGYAGSDKPKSGYDLDTLAGDILAFADAAAQADGVAADVPTHLVGHDWGAAVGWWAVLKAPQRFASYTAISVAHPRAFTEFLAGNDEQRQKSKYMKRLTLPLVPTFFAGMSDKKRRELYREGLTRKDAFGDSQLIWYRTAFDSRWETRGPLRYYKEKFRHAKANDKTAADAPKVAIPVLVLWGKKDKYLMWEMAEDSCKYVEPDRCEVQVFDEAGHWPHWDDPTGVVQRWRQFVAAERLSEPARAPAELESVAPPT